MKSIARFQKLPFIFTWKKKRVNKQNTAENKSSKFFDKLINSSSVTLK